MLGYASIPFERRNQHHIQNAERIIRSIDDDGPPFGAEGDVIRMPHLHHFAIGQAQAEGMEWLGVNRFFDGINRHIRFVTQTRGVSSA